MNITKMHSRWQWVSVDGIGDFCRGNQEGNMKYEQIKKLNRKKELKLK